MHTLYIEVKPHTVTSRMKMIENPTRNDLVHAVSALNLEKLKTILDTISDSEFQLSLKQYTAGKPARSYIAAHQAAFYSTIVKYIEHPDDQHIDTCMQMLQMLEDRGWNALEAINTIGISRHATTSGMQGHKLTYMTFYDEAKHQEVVTKLLTALFKKYGIEFSIDTLLNDYLNQFDRTRGVPSTKHIEKSRDPFLTAFKNVTGYSYESLSNDGATSIEDLTKLNEQLNRIKPI